MLVRFAEPLDLAGILDILNREIGAGFAHFGTEPMELEDLSREFESAADYPWFVATLDGELAGFARANPWKDRGGYRRTCEVGVYVKSEVQGRGAGKALYAELLPALRRLD